MGCQSCKNKGVDNLSVFKNDKAVKGEASEGDIGFKIFSTLVRVFMFGVGLALSPLILFFVWYLLFKTIILNNGSVNVTPALLNIATSLGIGKKKKNYEESEDYEDLDSDNPDDYELNEKVDKIKL